ncbi:hypothetical protein NDU88_008319 [Pleurodeles waltl]|uniref:Uncharacterized protein n=1 Tax=Pleurodeles waltl TaxID=8319 RepID=A0AAV7VW90_PLEWA|nr:hypothetical protein NDU88_008319 [Pleurodeles waltl]
MTRALPGGGFFCRASRGAPIDSGARPRVGYPLRFRSVRSLDTCVFVTNLMKRSNYHTRICHKLNST